MTTFAHRISGDRWVRIPMSLLEEINAAHGREEQAACSVPAGHQRNRPCVTLEVPSP